jgi:hypothetical protein
MTKINPVILAKAIDDWECTAQIEDIVNPIAFKNYMLDKYGIAIGSFMSQCTVVDENKYMMFILRWT